MKDLQNIRNEWRLAERVAFYIREKHPEIFNESLDVIMQEELKKKLLRKN